MILVRILGMKMFAPKYFLHLHQNGLHGDYLSSIITSIIYLHYIANGKVGNY